MKLSRTAPALGLTLLCLVAFYAPATSAAEDAPRRTMTITGTGTVTAAPDKAEVTIGVQTQAKTASDALARNNEAMWAVMEVLSQQGLARQDILTSTFSIAPRTVQPNNDHTRPAEVVGYTVTNEVRATVHDLDKIGALLDKAVSSGSNQVNDIRFAVDEPEPLHDEARRRAVRDAVRKAKLFAEEAGVTLGPIASIAENSGYRPRFQRTEMAATDASVPIAPGELSLQMQVTISWALAD